MILCPICYNRKTKFFIKKKNHNYYRCQNCNTLFVFPQPSKQDLKKYYQKDFSYQKPKIIIKSLKKRARRIIFQLKKMHKKGKTILDVGSGYGFFLEESKKNGLEGVGIEPSEKLFNYSTKKLHLKIKKVTLEKFLKINKRKFDFISLIHVIEHLSNPKKIILQLTDFLNKNGILYLETPNFDSYLFHAEQKRYTFLTPPDHLFIFSQYSFKKILALEKKLLIKKLYTTSEPEHLIGIIKKLWLEKRHLHRKKINVPLIKNTLEKLCLKKRVKIKIFNQVLAPLLTPVLNFGNKGSILALYIRKK